MPCNGSVRRALTGVSAVAILLVTAGWSSNTDPATNVGQTSATLNGHGTCTSTCTAYFQYARRWATSWTQTPQRTVATTTGTPRSEAVTNLRPGESYLYRLCGKENSSNSFTCAGPNPINSATIFTTPWSSGFESGNFGEWSYWNRPEYQNGEFQVAPGGTDGTPAHTGAKMAKFEVQLGQPPHAKLYQQWVVDPGSTSSNDDYGQPLKHLVQDASGTYSAWYYIPATGPNTDWSQSGQWSNIMQTKTAFLTPTGNPHYCPNGTPIGPDRQEPDWWIDATQAQAWPAGSLPPRYGGGQYTPTEPILVANHWCGDTNVDGSPTNWAPKLVSPPLNTWFKLTMKMYQGQRTEFYLNDNMWYQGTNVNWPSGLVTTPTQHSTDFNWWIFGVGLYGPGGRRLYIDDASYSPAG